MTDISRRPSWGFSSSGTAQGALKRGVAPLRKHSPPLPPEAGEGDRGGEVHKRAHHTTILAVKRGEEVAIAGDGQVTVEDMVLKQTAKKVRTVFHDRVIAGFAGAVADALTLFERFEGQMEKHGGQLRRAAVELAKEWRTDRVLRRLEAWLVVADPDQILVLSGEGDIIEPDEDAVGIGSGGAYALAAARALIRYTHLPATQIARSSMEIAADLCIFTNRSISVVSIRKGEPAREEGPG